MNKGGANLFQIVGHLAKIEKELQEFSEESGEKSSCEVELRIVREKLFDMNHFVRQMLFKSIREAISFKH